MEIEFELVDSKYVKVIGVDDNGIRKQIGRIFTPSSSSGDIKNAIQVCGFSEAFDYWGCGLYQRNIPKNLYMLKKIVGEETNKRIMAKDIQLLFDISSTEKNTDIGGFECWKCYDKDGGKIKRERNGNEGCKCVCEQDPNYFKIWREKELEEMKLIEYVPKKDGEIKISEDEFNEIQKK